MLKSLRNALLLIGFILTLASCENSLENKMQEMSLSSDQKYGSLTLINSSNNQRSLDMEEISYASIRISGNDIPERDEPGLPRVAVINGRNAEDIVIKKIPAGKNRIVKVQALDENGKEINGIFLRAVVDIEPDKNTNAIVSNKTTSYGNVIYELKEFFSDLSNPGKETLDKLEALKNAVDDTVHPSLFDYKNLTLSYKAFSPLMDKSFYILKTGSFTFDYLLNDDFTIHVNDPVSNDVSYQKAGYGRIISGIAPGIWNLFIKDKNGNILQKTEINIKSGIDTKISHLPFDGIAVIARKSLKYDNLYYWGCKEDSSLKVTWPGKKATHIVQAENAEDSEYYVFTFNNISQINCLLTNDSEKKYHEEDIKLTMQGVYCIHSTKVNNLTDTGIQPPSDFKLSEYPIEKENYETFYYDDAANRRIIMLIDPSTWNMREDKKIQNAKIEFNKGINDFGGYQGFSANFTKDESEVWYTLVPYDKIRSTNQSGQPTYKISVNGENFNCHEKLVSKGYNGYTYTKYSSKTPGQTFPVIIYSRQNKERIIRSLENEKSYKHIEDYDLTKEEDQKKLANFRLVPGTTALFRSYHPYNASKTEFGTEPYRMYFVAKLAEKYGIKSDLNVGGDESVERKTTSVYDGFSVKSIDNYLPSYYEQIEKNGNILYLYRSSDNPKWSYDVGYSNEERVGDLNENSIFFAKCMGRMVKFINSHPAPYQIHCSIGTDRTGTTCGILAALCGASINQIEEDYCASQNMGIFEFRGPGCVKFALEEFIRVTDIENPAQVPDLQKAVITRLTTYGNVTAEEVNTCIQRLGGKLPESN